MPDQPASDWDPRLDEVQHDQVAAYDHMRETQEVAYSEMLGWSVFGHASVLDVLNDPVRFSSVVSRHVAVPNGMDPPEHTTYRRLIDPYFTAQRIAAFRPACERIAGELLAGLHGEPAVDLAARYALPFAARGQCAFMGWPETLAPELVEWVRRHHQASFAQDRPLLAMLGEQFVALVAGLLEERRARGARPDEDITSALLHEEIDGKPLAASVLASIVRNWTVGEIGTIAAAVGIVAEWLARHPGLQAQLRERPEQHIAAIDEILRLHGPLVANRRVTTCPVSLAGRTLPAGASVVVHWSSANRDPRVFEAADEFRFGRPAQDNLLYGAGIHVCPGAAIARMQLGVALRALLDAVSELSPLDGEPPERAHYPAMGFARLPLRVRWTPDREASSG